MREADPLILRDGRRLAHSFAGPESGFPVLYLHGAIGSPLQETAAFAELLERRGIRYISVNRPGFAGSDPLPGRTIVDFAHDVEQLADALALERFAVVGVSAGGPYALACGHELPERVSAVGAISSLSPLCAPHDTPEMPAHLRHALRLLAKRPGFCARAGELVVATIRRHPGLLVRAMTAGTPSCDRRLLDDPGTRGAAVASFLAAAADGVRGMVEDYVISSGPWGFELTDVDVDVHVYHGARDALVPVDHALQLAATLPRCHAALDADEGHFLFRRRLGSILDEVTRPLAARAAAAG